MNDECPTIIFEGQQYGTGCLPRRTTCGDGTFKPVKDSPIQLIPESEWTDFDWSSHFPPELHVNQKQQNSCNAAATAHAMIAARSMAGMKPVMPSWGSLYHQINRGRDQGSRPDEGLLAMMEVGMMLASDRDPYDWRSPVDESKCYLKVEEAWECWTEADFYSAGKAGYPILFGTDYHAKVMCGYRQRDRQIKYKNSWPPNWGPNRDGFGWEPLSGLPYGARQFGAWALRFANIPQFDEEWMRKRAS